MIGEMCQIDPVTATEPNGTEWPIHAAIAKAVGGTVRPFDQYQGPYIVIGSDVRIGTRPYQLAPLGLGIVRLWVNEDTVYREDTDTGEPYWDTASAISAALSLLAETKERI